MPNYLFTAYLLLIMIIYQLETISYSIKINNDPSSPPSSCGSLRNISYPFRLTNPPNCKKLWNELCCENNRTVLHLSSYQSPLYVEAINYNNYTIRVVDSNVKKDNCSSIPIYPFSTYEYWDNYIDLLETEIRPPHARESEVHKLTQTVIFLSCEKPLKNSRLPNYVETAPCINGSADLSEPRRPYSYAVVNSRLIFSELEDSCRIDLMTLISTRMGSIDKKISSYKDIHKELAYGFELSWLNSCHNDYVCEDPNGVPRPSHQHNLQADHSHATFSDDPCGFLCSLKYYAKLYTMKAPVSIEIILTPRMICVPIAIALLIYKWRTRNFSMYDGIEEFLQNHKNLMPIRYSYGEITQMTRGFKEKLGEGGFGSVYKGMLSSGRFVAIKILGKSKANGQDFINEVATIGRIHHVNVVQLIGFCVSGSKRALVFDFMPNGSLDKYIFSAKEIGNSLNYRKIFEISLGIARGIEYLHQGCNMQILHFDIKPHNILLDENFVPKVSDFGLARLCPLDNSIVSLTAARGTIGYIAPELFYKNIGGVSYKADVYSFGMLLMEMANKRKNVNANAKKSSQIYFPLWIYDQFSKGNEIEIEDATEEESKTAKKMIIVALWCIQLKPSDRPSMNKVIEMLEGEVESLKMPPKPYLYPQEQEHEKHDVEDTGERSSSATPSEEDSEETSLVSNAN